MPESHNPPPRLKPYILSVKIVLLDSQGDILLLRRAASSHNNPGKWDFPGGKIAPGEPFDTGLMREVLEETGLHITLARVLGATESESSEHRIAYLLMEGRTLGGPIRLSEEHDAAQWVTRQVLAKADLVPQLTALARQYALEKA
jgi:8-oxo-dGTP diphosphatase